MEVKWKSGTAVLAKLQSVLVKLGRSRPKEEETTPLERALTTPRHMPVTSWFCVDLTLKRVWFTGIVTDSSAWWMSLYVGFSTTLPMSKTSFFLGPRCRPIDVLPVSQPSAGSSSGLTRGLGGAERSPSSAADTLATALAAAEALSAQEILM